MPSRPSPTLRYTFGLILALGGLGCDEDPIVIGPSAIADAGAMGDTAPSEEGAGGRGGVGGAPPMPPMGGPTDPSIEPDFELFRASVERVLYNACGGCHTAAVPTPADPFFTLVDDGPDGLSVDQQRLNFEEAITFADFADPPQSPLLVYHPPGFQAYVIPGSQTYNRILAWVEDAIGPGDGGAGGQGGAGGDGGAGDDGGSPDAGIVPCEGLPPPGSPAGRSRAFRDAFDEADASGETINGLLVGSCAETGACHGSQGVGGGYWLVPDLDDPCGRQWNYLSSQWFIDLLEPDASPLLTRPRERDHGGRVVFRGRDDPRHVRLLLWIEGEAAR